MNKILFTLAVLLLISTKGFCQGVPNSEVSIQEIVPPSREAFQQSILSQSNSSQPSGEFSYEVPLYTIKVRDFEWPLALNYSSGVRVNDIGGSVGMSWNANITGVISRVVNGKADEKYEHHDFNISKWLASDAKEWEKFKNTYPSLSKYDTEYDLFNFSLSNGLGGEFYINKSLEVFYNGKDNIKISLSFRSGHLEFVITDQLGNKYVFGGDAQFVETVDLRTLYQSGPGKNYVSAWYLSKVQTIDNESIEFSYEQNILNYNSSVSNSMTVQMPCNSGAIVGNYRSTNSFNISRTLYSSKRLKTIKSSNSSVEFKYEKPREDIVSGSGALLTGFAVVDVNKNKVMDYSFSYLTVESTLDYRVEKWYRPDSQTDLSKKEKRYFLERIVNNNDNSWYQFSYNNPSKLPSRFSFAQDSDGFANGKNNTSPFSTLENSTNLTQYEQYAQKGDVKKYLTADNSPTTYGIGLANLSRITYPTKGYSDIIYEGHRNIVSEYRDVYIEGSFSVTTDCGVRKKTKSEIIEVEKDGYLQLRVYGDADYYACPNASPFPTPDFHDRFLITVREVGSDGVLYSSANDPGVVVEKTYNSCNGGNIKDTCPILLKKGKKYSIELTAISYFNQMYGTVFFTLDPYKQLITENKLISGGERLSKVTDYNFDHTKIAEKQYFYNTIDELESDSSSMISRHRSPRVSMIETEPICYDFSMKEQDINFPIYYSEKPDRNAYVFSDSGVDNEFFNKNNKVYYRVVTERIGDVEYKERHFQINSAAESNLVYGKFKLPFFPLSSTTTDPFLLKKEIWYKKNKNSNVFSKVLEEESTYIMMKPNLVLTSYRIQENYTPHRYLDVVDDFKDPFTIMKYNNSLSYSRIASKRTIKYEVNSQNGRSQEEIYEYQGDKLSSLTTKNALGDSFRSEYLYAEDLGDVFLINKNRVGVPLEVKKYMNGLQSEFIKYNFNNYIYPERIDYYGRNSVDLVQSKNILYDKTFNNIIEIESAGQKTVFLHGYNKGSLIAKIENASALQVGVALGKSVSDLHLVDESYLPQINGLRDNNKILGAHITTFEYKPLVGVIKITSPNGLFNTFDYNKTNRLERIKDYRGNIEKEYEYNFKN